MKLYCHQSIAFVQQQLPCRSGLWYVSTAAPRLTHHICQLKLDDSFAGCNRPKLHTSLSVHPTDRDKNMAVPAQCELVPHQHQKEYIMTASCGGHQAILGCILLTGLFDPSVLE